MAENQTYATLRQLLDVISRSNGIGSLSSNYADLLGGYNHRNMGAAIPVHTEGNGLVFFTRPNFNLSYDNLSQDPMLTPLLTSNPRTYQAYMRAVLDPVGGGLSIKGGSGPGGYGTYGQGITTPFFDNRQAFIPILTNALLSMNGWPDISLDTYTAKEGRLRENWTIGDGTSKNYTVFPLNATFRNFGGDPITLLFAIWTTYIDHVHQDVMTPHLENIMENRVDYQTRIFRFTLDPSRTRIQKFASGMGCFPVGVPVGAAMNFTHDTPYNHDNQSEVSIGFQCQGAEYFNPIVLQEFNEIVAFFNPDMADGNRTQSYTKVPYQFLKDFNWNASQFPWINVQTSELEWWVDAQEFDRHVTAVRQLATAAAKQSTYSIASAASLAPNAPVPSTQLDKVFAADVGYGAMLSDLAADRTEPSA